MLNISSRTVQKIDLRRRPTGAKKERNEKEGPRPKRSKGVALIVGDESVTNSSAESSEGKEYLILDSGATEHYFKNHKSVSRRAPLKVAKEVSCANGEKVLVTEIGDIDVRLQDGSELL